jgi:hypothetical protein
MAIVALQVGVSFLSVRFFLEGELILGIACFLAVSLLALLIGFYYLWLRQKRKARS